MTRIPEITLREQLPEAQRHHFDAIFAPRGAITVPFRYLLHVPEFAARMAHMLAYSRYETQADAFPDDVKELAICVTAREMDCAFEWADHEQRARAAGVSSAAIDAIKHRRAIDDLAASEAQVVRYIQEMLRPPHRITDAVFQAMRSRLGDARLVELTALIGAYVALSCTFNAFDVAPTAGLPMLPP